MEQENIICKCNAQFFSYTEFEIHYLNCPQFKTHFKNLIAIQDLIYTISDKNDLNFIKSQLMRYITKIDEKINTREIININKIEYNSINLIKEGSDLFEHV